MSDPFVVLVGASGAGKTTVGRALAEALGGGFVDSDDLLADAAGIPLDQVMIDLGEPGYRELERDAVARALATSGSVVAVGAGAVADDVTRQRLSSVPVAWLRVSAANAANRSGLNAPRPVGLGNVRATLAALMAAQAPNYADVADIVVETDFRSVADIASEIRTSLDLKGSARAE
ncbi:MAG: shikimate kinase [Candidatus Nanopelagicales bacterium]